MTPANILGQRVSLPVLRFGPPGAFLGLDGDDKRPGAVTLLLPGSEVPEGAREGDEMDVFVYLDSADRPIATTRTPKLMLGEVAFLEVTDKVDFGAFVDWGLPKELLVPHAEQTRELVVGDRHPVGLFVDDTGRLAGTMKVGEMLREKGDVRTGQWIDGEAWRDDGEIGLFAILRRKFVGLVPGTEPHRLSRGDAASFRVATVLPDGKIELSLRGEAHEELENDARKILAVLMRPGAPKAGDRSSPEDVRVIFGLSKKAFKRAAGRLLKEGLVAVDRDGFFTPVRSPRRR